MFRSRRCCVSITGAVAWSLTAADTALSILDAASFSASKVSFQALAVAAGVFDSLALCSLILFSLQYAWKRDGFVRSSTTVRRILTVSCVLVCLSALAVSIATLITAKARAEEVKIKVARATTPAWNDYVAARFIVWALACITQIVLFSSPFWNSTQPEPARRVVQSGPRDSVMSEIRTSNHTAHLYMMEPTQPSSPLAALPSSPTFSGRSSQSLKSLRDSLHQVVRPVSSRTKLIRPTSSRETRSLYSDDHSVTNYSQPDGFDTWDTSSVEPQTKESVLLSAGPSRGTALETIPGSRPASPARALDGPFPLASNGDDLPLSPPPRLRPDLSRPPSPAVSEAHIHPLFRSESPVPPPAATPGTQIIASPFSNQMITSTYARSRSNSHTGRPTSPLPSNSFRDRAISPQRQLRSPSPPSREMTPPIPDFVLNSTPRSSLGGRDERRKLRPSPSP